MPAAEDTAKERISLRAQYAESLESLAQWCDERQLPGEARQTRGWLAPPDALLLRLADLPLAAAPSADDSSPDAVAWRRRFQSLRSDQAKKLYSLELSAIQEKQPALAAELLRETLREDPVHPAAWKRMSCTPPNRKTEPKVTRLNATSWRIETEHYRITSRHSREAGIRLAAELEFLYRAWRQVFLRYYIADKKDPSVKSRKHEVLYFRDRAEYQEQLGGAVPADYVTTGIYMGDQKTAYFYHPEPEAKDEDQPREDHTQEDQTQEDQSDAEEDHTTLYHEATHQLFSEVRPVVQSIGADANFWVVEGAACYMESLQRDADGRCTVGSIQGDRFQAARANLLQDGFYVPLAELTKFGMQKLQRDKRIAKIYSQSAGLTHFLMHHGDGRYRDALALYLLAVYSGRDNPQTLSELTGESYETLDKEYRQFMEGAK